MNKMRYFGIKTIDPPTIFHIADSEMGAWQLFFNDHAHRLPLHEAIKAYEGLGYKCVELEIKEIPDQSIGEPNILDD